jgi:3',5'-cyclic AMP phosphodiesterase CpdA
MSLATFMHISDLHMGQIDKKSLNARRQALKRWRWLQGLLGHSADSLMDLDEFFYDLRNMETEVQLIVTGDLTAMAHRQEFDIANQFLAGILRGPEGDRVGLEVLNWSDRAIPGNHDHWAGKPIPIGGGRSPALRRYFPKDKLPQIQPVFPLGDGRQLRLLQIDTDADVGFRGRLKALGSFVSQLKTLTTMLASLGPNDNEIRVLCLHHSPTYRGPTLEITPTSRTELHKFILQNQVAVLLCGHIHRPPWAKLFSVGSGVDILEACCGTTTQIDPTIGRKEELEGLVDTHCENSLFVHRLLEWNGNIKWETELYLEGRAGFVRADRLRGNIPAVTHFKVWPWPPGVL